MTTAREAIVFILDIVAALAGFGAAIIFVLCTIFVPWEESRTGRLIPIWSSVWRGMLYSVIAFSWWLARNRGWVTP